MQPEEGERGNSGELWLVVAVVGGDHPARTSGAGSEEDRAPEAGGGLEDTAREAGGVAARGQRSLEVGGQTSTRVEAVNCLPPMRSPVALRLVGTVTLALD